MSNVRIEFIEESFRDGVLTGTVVFTITSVAGSASMREECCVRVEELGKQITPRLGDRGFPIAMHATVVQEAVSNMMSVLHAMKCGTKPYLWIET